MYVGRCLLYENTETIRGCQWRFVEVIEFDVEGKREEAVLDLVKGS